MKAGAARRGEEKILAEKYVAKDLIYDAAESAPWIVVPRFEQERAPKLPPTTVSPTSLMDSP